MQYPPPQFIDLFGKAVKADAGNDFFALQFDPDPE